MTRLELLRALVFAGAQVAVCGGGLVVDAPAGVLTSDVDGAIEQERPALIRLLDPTALRIRFQVPPDQPIGATQALVMAWLGAERDEFSPGELAAYEARIVERVATGDPEYCARVLAIEDVVRGRVSDTTRILHQAAPVSPAHADAAA